MYFIKVILLSIPEGEERVKWELGFALFLSGKMGLASLELGCLKVRMGKNKMGLLFINHKNEIIRSHNFTE